MAHMDLGPLSISPMCSPPGSPKGSAAAAAGADASIRSSRGKASVVVGAGDTSIHSRADTAAAASSAGGGGLYGTAGTASGTEDEGTQHSAISYASSLQRAASLGDRSTHLTQVVGAPELPTGRFKKTLSMKRSPSGLLVGKYVLEPSDGGSSVGGLFAGNSHHGGTGFLASIGVGSAAATQVRSVHAGNAFFNAAVAAAPDKSTGAASAHANKTVHGGTAHAATKQTARGGGIFYQG